ncbi:MAG: SusD/RagB family nutrient-binding outer membrane lipoprotein [Cyclobacteriaceae bacterium]|nr:SusD/RagB family nutrient-binding outer membrane lipoprotein [Cyclobacteriaceae bacterium]
MKKLIYTIFWVIFLSGVVSCADYIEGFDDNPNDPRDADPTNLIQGVMIADMMVHTGDVTRLIGMWTNQFTGADRQYVTLDNWNGIQANSFNAAWGNIYAGVIGQSRLVQEKSSLENNLKLRGVAKVLEAHALGTATALWGDVPNTQANNVAEYPNPIYDDQQAVYSYLQTVLTSAIADLGGLGTIPASKDIFYGGSALGWTQLAHSLKARYFLHTGNYANAESEAVLGIASDATNFSAPFANVYNGSFSPYYSFLVYDRPGYMSAADAHAPQLLDAAHAKYRGNAKTNEAGRFGWTFLKDFNIYNAGYELNFLNGFDWGWSSNGKFGLQFPLVTRGETLLIIAEARIRQNDEAGAISAYNNYRSYLRSGGGGFASYAATFGLTVQYDDYSAADFETGGIENPDGITASEAILREILEERYIYFIGEFESFNDWRRTNNLLNIPIKGGNTQIPQRLLYPQTEVDANRNTPSPLPGIYDKTKVNQ